MKEVLTEILFELRAIKKLLRIIASNTERTTSYSKFVESLSSAKSLVKTENNSSDFKRLNKQRGGESEGS